MNESRNYQSPKPEMDSNCWQFLQQANLDLEHLTRDCFVLARDRSEDSTIDDLFFEIRERLTLGLGSIVEDYLTYLENSPEKNTIPDNARRIFFAPNYRGIRGNLIDQPIVETEESKSSKHLAYHEYAWKYGCLAEGRVALPTKKWILIDLKKKKYFMPVAFWVYKLYEKDLKWGSSKGSRLQIAGFSKWLAINGFLFCKQQERSVPVYGFHSSFETIHEGFDSGILHTKFAVIKNGSTALDITNQFLRSIEKENCFFSHGASLGENEASSLEIEWTPSKRKGTKENNSKLPGFPVIKGDPGNRFTEIANAVFSAFFYSNFLEPVTEDKKDNRQNENENWLHSISKIIRIGMKKEDDGTNAVFEQIKQFLERYKAHIDNKPEILTFKHFYSFLLNPGLSFKSRKISRSTAALGTVNFYTNIELPSPLISLIRKHVEAVYHFLRDLEEWEEGVGAGKESEFLRWMNIMRHESTKAYKPFQRLLAEENFWKFGPEVQRLVLDFSREAFAMAELWTLSGKNKDAIQALEMMAKDSFERALERLCVHAWKFKKVEKMSGSLEVASNNLALLQEIHKEYNDFHKRYKVNVVFKDEQRWRENVWKVWRNNEMSPAEWLTLIIISAIGNSFDHCREKPVTISIVEGESETQNLYLEVCTLCSSTDIKRLKGIFPENDPPRIPEEGTFAVLHQCGQQLYTALNMTEDYSEEDFFFVTYDNNQTRIRLNIPFGNK